MGKESYSKQQISSIVTDLFQIYVIRKTKNIKVCANSVILKNAMKELIQICHNCVITNLNQKKLINFFNIRLVK